jgi:hypothetical protein
LEDSTGRLTIEVSPNSSENPEAFIFCAPSTVIKYDVKKRTVDGFFKPVGVAITGAVLLTSVDVFKSIANNNQLFLDCLKANFSSHLLGLLINLAIMIPIVLFTKRDLL